MNTINSNALANPNVIAVERYYRLHSWIYDLTRWSFLFGRNSLVYRARQFIHPNRVLEIGCGTGHNLVLLHRQFPEAQLTGIDLSAPMLEIANHKLANLGAPFQLLQKSFPSPDLNLESFDLIVCSYALSMFNPGWELAVLAARQLLTSNGIFAVVDFHKTQSHWFQKWMWLNHVSLHGHLAPMLHAAFSPCHYKIGTAYGGMWQYFLFLGCKDF